MDSTISISFRFEVCGQRQSALLRARSLQQQLCLKAQQIKELSANEDSEAQQRLQLLATGRQRAQERLRALKMGFMEVQKEEGSEYSM